ncbi:MAG: hypothetical protein AAFQ23_00410 [Cyanobacteria bacterium J06623_1]
MTQSNGNNSDRLDRIEQILEGMIAQSQQSNSRLDRIEQQSNQRLNRLEQIAQTTLSIAQKNREDIERTEQLTRRNAASIARLDEKMEQYIVEGREHREFIATQVDGIRVETRRIVEHLFGSTDS